MSSKLRKKPFYGWVVVGVCLLILCTMMGVRTSFGIFFKSFQNEFGLTRAATSSVFSAYMVLSAIFTVLAGWALDKYGPRLVVAVMGCFTGLSLLLTSQTASFWQLYLSYSLLLSIGTAGAMTVLMAIVSRWFDKKRGFALGIAGSGGALGVIVMAPFATYLISSFGWQVSYIVIGLIAWVVIISLSTLLRRDPKELGVWPDGTTDDANRDMMVNGSERNKMAGISLFQACRTRIFWYLLAIWLFFALCWSLVLTHLVPHATDVGISMMEASTVVSTIGIASILSRLITGKISDSSGRILPGIGSALLQAGALSWLIWAHEL